MSVFVWISWTWCAWVWRAASAVLGNTNHLFSVVRKLPTSHRLSGLWAPGVLLTLPPWGWDSKCIPHIVISLSTCHQLKSSERREPQVRKCQMGEVEISGLCHVMFFWTLSCERSYDALLKTRPKRNTPKSFSWYSGWFWSILLVLNWTADILTRVESPQATTSNQVYGTLFLLAFSLPSSGRWLRRHLRTLNKVDFENNLSLQASL